MMEKIIIFLSHTPTYVYFIFCYLIIVGLKSLKDREVSIFRLAIPLFIFMYFFINGISKLELSYPYYIVFSFVLIFSCYLGWIQLARKKIVVNKKKMSIVLPGSWTTLILVLAIFSSKYYLGYKCSRDPLFVTSAQAKLLTMIVSGWSLGFVVGRWISCVYQLKSAQLVGDKG